MSTTNFFLFHSTGEKTGANNQLMDNKSGDRFDDNEKSVYPRITQSTVLDLFQASFNSATDALAVVFGEQTLTYLQLDQQSNQLAYYLQTKGIREESMVPLVMEKSLEMVIAILGILKSGGAYVPIDPQYPKLRIEQVLSEINATVLLTHQQVRGKAAELIGRHELMEWEMITPMVDSQPLSRPNTQLQPQHLAYVIFTSGSTGKPKGVLIEHAQLFSSTLARNNYYTGFSNLLLIPPISFDASVGAIFGSLTNGGCLYLCSRDDLQNVQKLSEIISSIDTLLCVPSYYEFLLDERLIQDSKLSKVILGGETLSPKLVSKHLKLHRDIALYNEYGPSEATVWATVERIESEESPISIGLPISGVQTYIFDQAGDLAREKQVGELYIGGSGIARGYLNDPLLTKEKFIPNPFNGPGSKMYRTGDLCYYLPNGKIVYAGRTDGQVKVNGHRIELGEIEALLLENEQVKQAVVIAKKSKRNHGFLVAFIIATGKIPQKSLRTSLLAKLPAYMVPNLFVELAKFPLTPNGKVDRQSLEEMKLEAPVQQNDEGLINPNEAAVQTIWQTLFDGKPIGINDDFFESGGNSLLAMRLVASINRQLRVAINVKDVFTYPTIAELSLHISFKDEEESLPEIKRNALRQEYFPLSFGQKSLWFIDQLEGSLAYHLPIAIKIDGTLNIKALTQALKAIVERHEMLRTVVEERQDGLNQHLLAADNWQLDLIDKEAYQEGEALLEQLIQLPFDLSKDFMLRASLISAGNQDYILLLVIHHISFDAWSKAVLLKELLGFYQAYHKNGDLSGVSTLPIQFSDYVVWENEQAIRADFPVKVNYWKNKLKGSVPLQLPSDLRVQEESFKGATTYFRIPSRLAEDLNSLSKDHGVTLFMTLLAGFKTLMYRYSGQEDICVGTAIAGRENAETENLVGYFLNTLALRTELDGKDSFLELLDKVKTTTLGAFENKEVPFEKVVAETGIERKQGQNPLFQVMFLLQNVPQADWEESGDPRFSLLDVPQGHSKFDLTFSLTPTASGIQGTVEYRTGKYGAAFIERMTGHYLQLLEALTLAPSKALGKLNMLGAEDRQLLSSFNPTFQPYLEDQTVIDLLQAQARLSPHAPALIFGEQEFSYQQLDEKSNQFAYLLKSKGVKNETMVLLCMPRSFEMVVGMLGILKAGAAYVPIDPEYPGERIKFIQEDTASTVAVCSEETSGKIPPLEGLEKIIVDLENPDFLSLPALQSENAIQSRDLAYVIYTSGSTGKPKGVMIEHGNLFSFICWCKEEFSESNFDIVYAVTSICFDLSIFELFYPLTIGKPIRVLKDGLEIHRHLPLDSSVLVNTVPSVVGFLLEQNPDWGKVSVLNMAGEPIPAKTLEKLDVDKIEIRNLYGPSEDTTYSTVYPINRDKNLLIGRPISNTAIYILNPENELNPVGIPGEICIAGLGVSRGYLNRRDLTQESFVPNPFEQALFPRIYKTGDRGRWTEEGQIEYLGRNDSQVKIRGYRIELGEIERTLELYEEVKQAVVLVQDDSKQLIAYLVIDNDAPFQPIIEFLKQQLPAYMIPALWVKLDVMPLTANGKIDKKALPSPESADSSDHPYVAPRNPTEKDLADIWKTLLRVERVGVHDDFFQLGGHSLLITGFIAAVRKRFKVDLRIQDLFSFPTLAGLTAHFDFESYSLSLPPLEPVFPKPQLIPLSYNQESLWFIDKLSGSHHYHIPTVLKMEGDLDKEALVESLSAIVERHEVLRTVIQYKDGRPWQIVKDSSSWSVTLEDGSRFKNDLEGEKEYIGRVVHQPFDLSKDYMIRATLMTLDEQTHLLILVLHHIASDGWSTALLLTELTAMYQARQEGSKAALPPLPIQYADFALWQREYIQGEYLKIKTDYWVNKLNELRELHLPLDYERPRIQSIQGAVSTFTVDQSLKERLLAIGQKQGATLHMTLLTVLKLLLYRYSSLQDLCVGTAVAGRQHQDAEKLIGYFVNILPIRSWIEPKASFSEVLQEVKANCLEAYENQEVPFDHLVAKVGGKRDLSKNPLFQVVFVLQNLPIESNYSLHGMEVSEVPLEQSTSKFDLSFIVSETVSGLQLSVEYATALFNPATVNEMVGRYLHLLKLLAFNPSTTIQEVEFPSTVFPEEVSEEKDSADTPAHSMVDFDKKSDLVNQNLNENILEEKWTKKLWRKLWK